MQRIWLIGAALLLGLVGCSDSGSDAGTGGASGSGGSAGTSGSAGSSGSGGSSGTAGSGGSAGSSGAGGSAGGACHGDATEWAAITQAPIACSKHSDCCVVINSCLNQAQIVGKTDFDTASAAWPYCDAECNDCVAPAVDVVCSAGTCGLLSVDPSTATPDQSTSRCGDDTLTLSGDPKEQLGCGV